MELEFGKAPVGAYELRYLDVGRGPTVLLIHGLAGDLSGWLPLIERLRPHYRVVAFDNRGAGQSSQVDEPVTTADLAGDTLGLMDHLGIDCAHIVGRSMGGAIAQIMALRAPERIASLILCASFARLDPLGVRVLTVMREVLEWRGNWQDHARHGVHYFLSARTFNANPGLVEKIEHLIGGESRLPAAYCHQSRACIAHDTVDQLAKIRQPVLVLAGAQDPVASAMATGQLSEGLTRTETIVFDDASHFFLLEQPERFGTLVSDWLTRQVA